MVTSVNTLLSKVTHMQEEMDAMWHRQKVQDDLILNGQVSKWDQVASAHKHDKDLRLGLFWTD